MKKNKLFTLLAFLVINLSLFAQTKSLDCQRQYNTFLEKQFKKQNCKYNLIQDSLKFIIECEINESGDFISIKIAKSNLKEFGINEERIIKRLTNNKMPCLYSVYYSEPEKPDKVILIFNNELVE